MEQELKNFVDLQKEQENNSETINVQGSQEQDNQQQQEDKTNGHIDLPV